MSSGSTLRVDEQRMKAEWDERAGEGFRFIDWRAENEAQLMKLAEIDISLILADVAAYLPVNARALEIGCGLGRLLPGMARRFSSVCGVDISTRMLDSARNRVADYPNVTLVHTPGSGLPNVPDSSFDFCYSIFTFECIADRPVIEAYMREAHRVLATGGIFKFNVAGVYPRNPFRPFYEDGRDTYAGARFTMAEITALTENAGFEVLCGYHANELVRGFEEGDLNVQGRIWIVARKGIGLDDWESGLRDASQAVARLVPEDATVAVSRTGVDGHLRAAGTGDRPILAMSNPDFGSAAVDRLEALRSEGARYLLILEDRMWWPESYPELFEHLRTKYREIERTPTYILFDIRETKSFSD